MTEVNFHSKVPDVLPYVYRLLRKAYKRGSRAVVTAPAEVLGRLDPFLWTHEDLDFLPHLRLPRQGTVAPRLLATPIWLAEPGQDAPVHEVLVNLGPDVATGFEAYERVFEIVGTDADAVAAGRRRWRHYQDRGYAPVHHEASAG